MFELTASFERLVARLSAASVERRWEAYRDVAWDDPASEICPEDPRWMLPDWDVLGASAWYRDQAPDLRSRIGLDRTAAFMRAGVEFEGVLKQGLLAFAAMLPNGDPRFRYVYHEISEETQHSMMFQEFVNRSGCDPGRVAGGDADASVIELARAEPVLFFLVVLAGEEPIDYVQRRVLAAGAGLHPLLVRIDRIHCSEEARHLSFARASVRRAAGCLGHQALRRIRYQAPLTVQRMAEKMLGPPSDLLARWQVPDEVRDDLRTGATACELLDASTSRIASLCSETGLIDARTERLWPAARTRV